MVDKLCKYKTCIVHMILIASFYLTLLSCKDEDELNCDNYASSLKSQEDKLKLLYGTYDEILDKYEQKPTNETNAIKCVFEQNGGLPKGFINARDDGGYTNFMTLLEIGQNKNTIKYLVEKQVADFNAKAYNGWSVLHSAVYNTNAKVTTRFNRDWYRFVLKVSNRFITTDALEYLISKGADIKAVDTHGNSVLKVAASNSSLDVVKYLAEKTELRIDSNNPSIPSVFLASLSNTSDVVKYLATAQGGSEKTRLNQKNTDGWTTLMLAAHNGNIDVVDYIMSKIDGLDIHVYDRLGNIYNDEDRRVYNNKTACEIVIIDIKDGFINNEIGRELNKKMRECQKPFNAMV